LHAESGYFSAGNMNAGVAQEIAPVITLGRAAPPLALRKQTTAPVFGVIQPVLGFRHFPLRGLDELRGEWGLVTMGGTSSGCSSWPFHVGLARQPAPK